MYELVRAGNVITDLMFQTAAPRLQGTHIGEHLDSPFPAWSFCSRVPPFISAHAQHAQLRSTHMPSFPTCSPILAHT